MEIFWDTLDQEAWQARLAQAPLAQSWEYGVAMTALGARVRRGLVCDAGREVAVVQVLERRGLRLISRGPVWLGDVPQAVQRRVLRRLAVQPGATVATPEAGVRGLGLVPLITPRHQALWDLASDPAVLKAGMARSWRYRLKRAEGLRVVQSKSDAALAELLTAEGVQRGVRRYRALPAAFAAAWPGERMLWQWRQGGRMAAGMLFLRHGPWASYHIAWANAVARAADAHRPMLWQAALALKAAGVRVLDLGDVNGEDAPGLALFKAGTGARVAPLGSTMLVLPG